MSESALSDEFADIPLLIGGTHLAKNNHYSYIGAIHPAWGGTLGKGWYQSLVASYLYYDYDTDIGGQDITVEASAPGLELGVGYIWSQPDYEFNLSLAAGYRYFDLSPNAKSEKPNGSQAILTPQLQARVQLNPSFTLQLISNVSLGPASTFNRIRLPYKTATTWQIGPEYLYQEGKNYRNQQWGIFTSIPFKNGLNLELSAGTLEEENGDNMAYIGLAFALVRWK